MVEASLSECTLFLGGEDNADVFVYLICPIFLGSPGFNLSKNRFRLN
jgi:hypothetical protein